MSEGAVTGRLAVKNERVSETEVTDWRVCVACAAALRVEGSRQEKAKVQEGKSKAILIKPSTDKKRISS